MHLNKVFLLCFLLVISDAKKKPGKSRKPADDGKQQTKLVNWCRLAFKCGELTGDFASAIDFVELISKSKSVGYIKSGAENEGTDFNCEVAADPPPTATTVHELTPYDIKVVGALGDSITAAFGAEAPTFFHSFEYRGVSWSIGGDDTLSDTTTLPNIIKKYNPNVKGFSLGTGLVDSPDSNLNVAVSGSIAQDMPGQAELLVERITNDESINIDEDWKVITLFIGGNNLCKYCLDKEKNSVQNYSANVKEALDILYHNLPRTFVNLAMIMDITVMADLAKDFGCRCVHGIACPCETDQETSEMAGAYQEAITQLIESGNYYNSNFTVVIQPLFTEMEIPTKRFGDDPDLSYFAPDCFHFSGKGSKEAAIALWNNMIQSIGEKDTHWNLPGEIQCPDTASPYFKTTQNS